MCLKDAELLLAWANLGALVEGWLKLFYCVYYEDYVENPRLHHGVIIEPNDMRFEGSKQFSRGILWVKGSEWDQWVDKIQQRRSAIHAINSRDIGTADEWIESINKFKAFINVVGL